VKQQIAKNDFLAAGACRSMGWYGLRTQPGPPDEGARFRMLQGLEIKEMARRRFPDGQLVSSVLSENRFERTQALIADGLTPTLYGAAFRAGPFTATADILLRKPGEHWSIVAVKSSFCDTDKMDEYVDDLAYTVLVLERAGLSVVETSLALLSREYRCGQDVEDLFVVIDKTPEVTERAAAFEEAADDIARVLLDDRQPASALVPACRRCTYFADECLGAAHIHTVFELPNLHHTKFKKLAADEIVSLADVPADFPLTDRQQRVMEAVGRQAALVDAAGLRAALGSIQWPCYYLDFETVATVLPLYEGCGCHQQVLTQFSIHERKAPADGLAHYAFLADAKRREEGALAQALIHGLGDKGSILVYGGFERQRLSTLGAAFPEVKEALDRITARLVDLCRIVTNHVYHPDFRGSFSLKAVLPALVPDLSYDGLSIADGDAAIAMFARMARGEITAGAAAKTREDLLAYCARDTMAMVRLHEILCEMSA
jgi:predicted RecB family nuclease